MKWPTLLWVAMVLAAGRTGFAPVVAHAHPAAVTSAEVTVEADGRYRVVMQFDTLAYALNDTSARIGNAPMESLLNGPRETLEARLADAKARFLRSFRVVTDRGPGSVETVDFPNADKVLAWKAAVTPLLPVLIAVGLAGRLPPDASTVTFAFPSVLDQVILTVERPDEEPTAEPVEAGATSTVFTLKLKPAAPVRPAPEPGASVGKP